ncbi:MAG TPA: formate/nitrite transporter family protein [Thermoanaerobaculia bacterium]|jgi:formate/nitrite transporter FocA (FNT family)
MSDETHEDPAAEEPEQDEEEREAEERSAPSGAVVYHAIHSEGESELERSSSALAWSGLAAGLSMGFSMLVPALIHAHLPAQAKWAPLVTSFGYTLGFMIVILGRQQLFTENTLTVILPLLKKKSAEVLGNVLRLWTVVLLANVIGAILFAFVAARSEAVDPEVFESMKTLAKHSIGHTFGVMLLRAIFAGWLIALLVWLLPFAETARVFVIVLMTYAVSLGHFSHVIAGSVDAAFLVWIHESNWAEFLLGFLLPTLLGNILGGVSLVAAINHAQVVAGGGGEDA